MHTRRPLTIEERTQLDKETTRRLCYAWLQKYGGPDSQAGLGKVDKLVRAMARALAALV